MGNQKFTGMNLGIWIVHKYVVKLREKLDKLRTCLLPACQYVCLTKVYLHNMSVYMPTTLHDHPFVWLPGCVILAYGTVYCILILVFGKGEI